MWYGWCGEPRRLPAGPRPGRGVHQGRGRAHYKNKRLTRRRQECTFCGHVLKTRPSPDHCGHSNKKKAAVLLAVFYAFL